MYVCACLPACSLVLVSWWSIYLYISLLNQLKALKIFENRAANCLFNDYVSITYRMRDFPLCRV